MKHVLVNGVLVIADGELVRDARPGKPVRRGAMTVAPIEEERSKVDVVGH
jgi:hypothetical protein